jgi:hypothetical protein
VAIDSRTHNAIARIAYTIIPIALKAAFGLYNALSTRTLLWFSDEHMQASSGHDLHLGLDLAIAPIEVRCLIQVRHVCPLILFSRLRVVYDRVRG